jgi:hypothetical protein
MLRGAFGLTLALVLASGCTIQEKYSIPDEALHTLTGLRGQLDTTAVPGRRVGGADTDRYVRADTLNLDAAGGVNSEGRVNVTSSADVSTWKVVVGGALAGLGAAGVILGSLLTTTILGDGVSGSALTGGGIALAVIGGVALAGGAVTLGLAFTDHPMEMETGKAGILYLDQTGRLPAAGVSLRDGTGHAARVSGLTMRWRFQ